MMNNERHVTNRSDHLVFFPVWFLNFGIILEPKEFGLCSVTIEIVYIFRDPELPLHKKFEIRIMVFSG